MQVPGEGGASFFGQDGVQGADGQQPEDLEIERRAFKHIDHGDVYSGGRLPSGFEQQARLADLAGTDDSEPSGRTRGEGRKSFQDEMKGLLAVVEASGGDGRARAKHGPRITESQGVGKVA